VDAGYLHTGTRGRVLCKIGAVYIVYFGELIQVVQKNRRVDRFVKGTATSFQNGLHIVQRLPGLGLYAFGHLVGVGIHTKLLSKQLPAVLKARLRRERGHALDKEVCRVSAKNLLGDSQQVLRLVTRTAFLTNARFS
jgi:hypothetical protein